jgi:hypothetical protein
MTSRLGYVRAQAQRYQRYQDTVQLLVAMGGGRACGLNPLRLFLAGTAFLFG